MTDVDVVHTELGMLDATARGMTTWVVAHDDSVGEDRFWVCTNPARLTEAWCAEARELADLATRTRVQTAWVDSVHNLMMEGVDVRSDEFGPYSKRSGPSKNQLEQLPRMAELLEEWKRNDALRTNTLVLWGASREAHSVAALPSPPKGDV